MRRGLLRPTPHDREIVRLAVPALGALAAEPLYVLADTGIVGHLGTRPLAGLAVAAVVLTAAYAVFNFLAYSTTAAVARRIGAGDRRSAAELGIDGMWLGAVIGVALLFVGALVAPVIVDAMGASAKVHPYAVTYLRISALGAPAYLVALAGAGFLRGLQDTRPTLVIAVAANAFNLVLEVALVYGLDTGIAGSAWGTVAAQWCAALAYLALARRVAHGAQASPWARADGVRAVAVIGGPLVVRTVSLLAVSVAATAMAARMGDDEVAAHQIAFQTFLFLALSLDALAIAGQALVGRFLGAREPVTAREVSNRLLELGVAVGVVLLGVVAVAAPGLSEVFSKDPTIHDLALPVLLVVAVLQPLAAVVFVLDGVLIGAGDQRYLAIAMIVATFGVFAPLGALIGSTGAGLLALWGAIGAWLIARGAGLWMRYVGSAWLVTGAVQP